MTKRKATPVCSYCGGTGRVRVYDAPGSYEYHYIDCSICLGTGRLTKHA